MYKIGSYRNALVASYTWPKSALDYTTFGSSIPELQYAYSDGADTSKYRFGFNNQEQDSELGEYYAFEYRIHDARLGRFLSVDPLVADYPWNSAYAFAENKVIKFIDLEGKECYDPWYFVSQQIGINLPTQAVETVNQSVKSCAEVNEKYLIPSITIAGGVVAIVATAGAATPALIASISILSGTMAVVGGSVKLGLNIAGKDNLASKVPTSYIGATVNATINIVNGENSTTKVVTGTLEIIEGILTLTFKDNTILTTSGNVITVISISNTLLDLQNKPSDNANQNSTNSQSNSNQSSSSDQNNNSNSSSNSSTSKGNTSSSNSTSTTGDSNSKYNSNSNEAQLYKNMKTPGTNQDVLIKKIQPIIPQ